MTLSQQLNALENEKSCIEFLQRARMHLARGMNWDDGDRFAWIVLTNAINEQIWGWMEQKFFIPEIQFGDCVAESGLNGFLLDVQGEKGAVLAPVSAGCSNRPQGGHANHTQPLITIFPERRAIVKTREERK